MSYSKTTRIDANVCHYNGGDRLRRTIDARALFEDVVRKAGKNLRDFACEMVDKGCPYNGDATKRSNGVAISAFIVNNGGLKLHLRCFADCPNKDFTNMCMAEPYQVVPARLAHAAEKELAAMERKARKAAKK